MKKSFWIILIIILAGMGWLVFRQNSGTKKVNVNLENNVNDNVNTAPGLTPAPLQAVENLFALPIADFKERITKKPFGVYITPQTSPVQPERFKGYHTGVDVEYQDATVDVPVFAVADGVVKLARIVSGYGGALILEIEIDGKKHSVLYGHLRPSSLPKVGATFKKGDQLAVLGTGYGAETDNERRHLHLAILSDNRLELLGYVGAEKDLAHWLDPLGLY